MAIKGKSKSRARRSVTPGPRPTYVPVKRPLLARRGFQITALVVVAVMAVGGIWFGLAKERSKQREREMSQKMRTAMIQYQSPVDAALAGVGQSVPPSAFRVLPAIGADLTGLRKGTVTAKTAAADAATAAKSAKTAADALGKIDPSTIFGGKGFGPTFVDFALNSHSKMLDALRLYETAADLLGMAAKATGDLRTQLLDRASGVLDVASSLFADGHNDYVNAQQAAGVFVPTMAGGGQGP